MGFSSYRRGRQKEYRAMRLLRQDGWKCSRSAASHSPVDIFAGKEKEVLLVQVKSEQSRMREEEANKLLEWARAFDARAEVWYLSRKGVRKEIIWQP